MRPRSRKIAVIATVVCLLNLQRLISQITSQKIPRKDLQKEMNEEFELITVTISLAATAMKGNNCRTATGKPTFSAVMQNTSRHVILPRAFGKEEEILPSCAQKQLRNKTSFGLYPL